MNSKEFKTALDVLCKEKGISEDIVYDAMELALTSAYKKNYHSLPNVRVDINRETGEIHIYSFKTVVEKNEYDEITAVKNKLYKAFIFSLSKLIFSLFSMLLHVTL